MKTRQRTSRTEHWRGMDGPQDSGSFLDRLLVWDAGCCLLELIGCGWALFLGLAGVAFSMWLL